jgi:hypothetical protein
LNSPSKLWKSACCYGPPWRDRWMQSLMSRKRS